MWTRLIIIVSMGLMVIGGMVAILAMFYANTMPAPPMLVYVHQTNAEIGNLYLLDVSRGMSTPLTASDTQHFLPTWSSDGNELLFVLGGNFNLQTGRVGSTRIIQMNMGSYGRRPLTANRGAFSESAPVWSKTNKVAYAVYDAGWDIVIIRPKTAQTQLISTSHQTSLNTSANEHTPQWSEDGTQLAYLVGGQYFSELAIADANGANPRMLTTGMRVYQGQYDWSPSGTHIIFTSERDGNREIYTVNVMNGALINLSRHPAHDSSPQWSPDGTHILFISERNAPTEIFVMAADGSDVRQITDNDHYLTHPIWSPDGRWIAYSADIGNIQMSIARDIFIVSVDGGMPRRLTFTPADDYIPIWKPS